nr:hypothetical protein [Lysinibacillus timonensis]
MNFKEELKRTLPANLTLTDREKASVRNRIHETNVSRYPLKPAFISVLFVLIVGVFVVANIQSTNKKEIASNEMNEPTVVDEASLNGIESDYTKFTILPLTDEQKQQYYEEYKIMVDEANNLKLGMKLELDSFEEFSYWVSLEDFEKRIQGYVDSYVQTEREKVKAASSNLKEVETNAYGETTKGTFMYISGILKEIEVTAKFTTQYSAEEDRQLISGVDHISSALVYTDRGEWEQTHYDASILDNGRMIRIRVEGIFHYLGTSYEKAFTIEYHCDEAGNIY